MSKPIALCWDIDVAPALFTLHLIRVEHQAGRVGEEFDECFSNFRSAMRAVKRAEMSIYLEDDREYKKNIESGSDSIGSALNGASDLVRTLEKMLVLLKHPPNKDDFASRRELVFTKLDYAKLHTNLMRRRLLRGNELWSAIIASFSKEGCAGALRMLRQLALTIENGIRREAAGFRKLAKLKGESALALLRSDIQSTAVVHISFFDFITACIYFTLVVEQASHLLLSQDGAFSQWSARRKQNK